MRPPESSPRLLQPALLSLRLQRHFFFPRGMESWQAAYQPSSDPFCHCMKTTRKLLDTNEKVVLEECIADHKVLTC